MKQLVKYIELYGRYVLMALLLVYACLKAYKSGADINVYLEAGNRIMHGENIYSSGQFNDYLYSPFFALLLSPLSILSFEFGRVLWAILNVVLAFRLLRITEVMCSAYITKSLFFGLCVFGLSFGYLNHNIILGQMSVVILWLTLEGLYQIKFKNQEVLGSFLLALGIIIKIVPGLFLGYLFLTKRFKSIGYILIFLALLLIIPSIFIGHEYNMTLLSNWADILNPRNAKYVLENNGGTQSLNALIPAYVHEFEIYPATDKPVNFLSLPYSQTVILVQISRLILLGLAVFVIFQKSSLIKNNHLKFWRIVSFFSIVSVLFFPHQQKYTLLYLIPACSYLVLFIMNLKRGDITLNFVEKSILYGSFILAVISALMGRDIVGKAITDVYDSYHVFSLAALLFLIALLKLTPEKLEPNP